MPNPALDADIHEDLTLIERLLRKTSITLDGTDYKIIAKRGNGNFGYVILLQAKDGTGTKRALKIPTEAALEEHADREEVLIARYEHEVTAFNTAHFGAADNAEGAKHHTIKIGDKEVVALSMPFFDGVDLIRALEQYPHLAAKIMLAVANELESVHARGIIHGDLKHNNLHVHIEDGNVIVKYLDFDHAYATEDATASLCLPHEGAHWAPERRVYAEHKRDDQQDEVSPAISQDVFSFGHMIKYCLANCRSEFLLSDEQITALRSWADRAMAESPADRKSIASFKELVTPFVAAEAQARARSIKKATLEAALAAYDKRRGFFRKHIPGVKSHTATIEALTHLCTKTDGEYVNLDKVMAILRARDARNSRSRSVSSTVRWFTAGKNQAEKPLKKDLTQTEVVLDTIAGQAFKLRAH